MKRGGESCVSCHRDPHRSEFDRLGMFREVEGQTGCLRCHDSASFRSLAKRFDHGKWTKFELVGAHAKVACASCHAQLREPDAHGRTWARAPGGQCADCHAEPHQGQFAERGRTDCHKCHRPTKDFHELVFNHDVHSRFRLGEAHRGVACAKCHLTVKEKGAEFVRYKPMKGNCVDCHGAQEDPFRRRGRSR